MSTKIHESESMSVTVYCGPEMGQVDRRRVAFNGSVDCSLDEATAAAFAILAYVIGVRVDIGDRAT